MRRLLEALPSLRHLSVRSTEIVRFGVSREELLVHPSLQTLGLGARTRPPSSEAFSFQTCVSSALGRGHTKRVQLNTHLQPTFSPSLYLQNHLIHFSFRLRVGKYTLSCWRNWSKMPPVALTSTLVLAARSGAAGYPRFPSDPTRSNHFLFPLATNRSTFSTTLWVGSSLFTFLQA